MEKVINKLGEELAQFGIKFAIAIIIIVIGFRLVNFLLKRFKKTKLFWHIEKSSQAFIYSIVSVILKGIILITAIAELGIPMSSIIAVVGSAGLALGLALQGGLSNIAGGVMIMIFKPFKVGDFIDTHQDSGTVKEINIFHTVITTYDNKVVVIPNSIMSNTIIVNNTGMKNRLLDLTVTVDYKSDIDEVKRVLNKIIQDSKYRLKDEDTLVALKEHGDSALIFTARYWVLSEDYWDARFATLEAIKKEFDKEKISIPYPQLDVHMEK